MSPVDIFYLVLVVSAIGGFAVALAYFSQADLKFRSERQRTEEALKEALKPAKGKAPVAERVLEHA